MKKFIVAAILLVAAGCNKTAYVQQPQVLGDQVHQTVPAAVIPATEPTVQPTAQPVPVKAAASVSGKASTPTLQPAAQQTATPLSFSGYPAPTSAPVVIPTPTPNPTWFQISLTVSEELTSYLQGLNSQIAVAQVNLDSSQEDVAVAENTFTPVGGPYVDQPRNVASATAEYNAALKVYNTLQQEKALFPPIVLDIQGFAKSGVIGTMDIETLQSIGIVWPTD